MAMTTNAFIVTFAMFIMIPTALLVACWAIRRRKRARSMLDHWAIENELQIVDSEFRRVLRGPFLWTSSKYQVVYLVNVREKNGLERSAWIRCGGYWTGLFTDKVEIKWNDPR
jgi:hypothetical protein